MTSLEGRIALVTGSALRTGRELALALARAGADVAIHYRGSKNDAFSAVDEVRALGRKSVAVQAELGDALATERAVNEAAEELGGLDILVNNVGATVWKKLDQLSPDEWRQSLDGTVTATYHATQAALPHLRRGGFGRIINILDSDADRLRPTLLATPYKIGKTGSLILTKSYAAQEAEHGITVNAVSPGTLENSEVKPPVEHIPAGRYGSLEDLAATVLFLASDAASYVTGNNIKVSGGYQI